MERVFLGFYVADQSYTKIEALKGHFFMLKQHNLAMVYCSFNL